MRSTQASGANGSTRSASHRGHFHRVIGDVTAVVVIRYADDFVIGFERKEEAERCWGELRDRFAQFGLKLHEGKTRLIEFGRHAARNRKARGDGNHLSAIICRQSSVGNQTGCDQTGYCSAIDSGAEAEKMLFAERRQAVAMATVALASQQSYELENASRPAGRRLASFIRSPRNGTG